MSNHPFLSFWSILFGAILGGCIGFVTYWTGAALLAAQALMAAPPETLPQEFQRPFYTYTAWEVVLVGAGMVLGAAVSHYRWRVAGLLGFIGLLSMAVGYIAYAVWVTIPSVPAEHRWLSWMLLTAEAGLLALVSMAAFYALDVTTRQRWDRIPTKHSFDPEMRPHVALMIPVFNEPPEMVEQTVAHACRQDYPSGRWRVMVLDDSTDQALARELESVCARLGAQYVRRPDRRGFKAGAINHGTALLPPEVELVGIIDADYWVTPDWLHSVVGHFVDPEIGFVQTPQDYRNINESFLTRQYKRAEAYFYHAMMPSRNEVNTIIFCGTMGIIRRSALEEVGGFAEDQICEDAEISVRLVAAGWNSMYVDKSFGKGLMPATFDAYKKQFHRWAFGNVKILFTHWWRILRSPMKRRQKLDYVVSNLHWFDGLFISIIAGSLLYLGLAPVLGYTAVTYHQKEIMLIALVPTLLLIDSMLRLNLVLRQAGHGRLRDAFLVQGMWFSIKYTNLSAVLKAMVGFKAPFVRTPKHSGGRLGRFRAFFRAMRVAKFESLMAVALFTVAAMDAYLLQGAPPGEAILPAWLAMYGLFFLCAPLYAYLSYRTLQPLDDHGYPTNRSAVEFRESPVPVRD